MKTNHLSQPSALANRSELVAPHRIKVESRRRLAAVAVCGVALMVSVLPAQAAPSARARQAAKECKAKYNQELTKLQSQQLTASDRETRTNAAYDDLAACLKANRMLSMLPKRPAAATAVRPQPANRTGTTAAPAATPAPKKVWTTRPASQTGSHL